MNATDPFFINGYFVQEIEGLRVGYSADLHGYSAFLSRRLAAICFSGTLFPGAGREGHILDHGPRREFSIASVRDVEHVPGEWLSFHKRYVGAEEVVVYRLNWRPDLGCFHGTWRIFSSLPRPMDLPDAKGDMDGEARCVLTPFDRKVAFDAKEL